MDALYGREEADEMEQRINEKFDEGIGRLERMMIEMHQNRKRASPGSNHDEERVSHHSDRSDHGDQRSGGRRSVDRDRRTDNDRDRRNDGGRDRYGSRDMGDRDRPRYVSDLEDDFDRVSIHDRG